MHQVQLRTTLFRDRTTEHTPAVLEHKIDFLRCDLLGGNDEITLVLAVFIVHYNHKLTLPEIVQRFIYGVYFHTVQLLSV